MKRTLIGMGVLGVMGGGIYGYTQLPEPTTETYEKPEAEIVEKIVNPRDQKIEARERELEEKYENIKKLEAQLDVLTAEHQSIEDEIAAVRTELAGFTIGTPLEN